MASWIMHTLVGKRLWAGPQGSPLSGGECAVQLVCRQEKEEENIAS